MPRIQENNKHINDLYSPDLLNANIKYYTLNGLRMLRLTDCISSGGNLSTSRRRRACGNVTSDAGFRIAHLDFSMIEIECDKNQGLGLLKEREHAQRKGHFVLRSSLRDSQCLTLALKLTLLI